MAQAWRSAASICRSSMCARPNSVFKTISRRPILSSARPIPYPASRHASVLGTVESMLPLHSTVAIARLKSNIASDTAFWSWLSQVFVGMRFSLEVIRFLQSRFDDIKSAMEMPFVERFCHSSVTKDKKIWA